MEDTEEAVPSWTGTEVPPDAMAEAVAELVSQSSVKKLNDQPVVSPVDGPHHQPQDLLAAPPVAKKSANKESSSGGWRVLIAAALVFLTALIVFMAVVWFVGRNDNVSSDDSSTSDESVISAGGSSESLSDGSGAAIDVPSESSNGLSTDLGGESDLLDLEHQALAEAAGESSWAVFENSVLYLRGKVPSQEFADRIEARVSAVMPSESIVVDFLIDPSIDAPVDPPLFVKERVEFSEGTAEIDPGSYTMINIAAILMKKYTVTDIAVLSYAPTADGQGLDRTLAAAQSQAVIDIWVSREIEPSRLTAEYIDNPNDTDQQWVEFVVTGLLE